MKSTYFYIFLFVLIISCKQENIKINEKLDGTWELEKFEYQNSEGKLIPKFDEKYTLTFYNNGKKEGLIKLDTSRFDVIYDFGYEQYDTGYSTCDLKVLTKSTLPINTIGKVQVYFYKFINNNTLEFKINNEYDYENKQVLKNVNYTFRRIKN